MNADTCKCAESNDEQSSGVCVNCNGNIPKPLGPGDDLQMMQSPDNWPNWPVLPMKKYGETPRDAMTPGILIELMASYEYAWVPGASMFDKVTPNDPRVQRFAKDNTAKLQEILADGWIVD